MSIEDDRSEAHAELAKERWTAHRDQHDGEKELAAQKWAAHDQQHESIAQSLIDYKIQSNEWRGSLSDLRTTFAGRAEVEIIETRLSEFREELRTLIATEREERREQQNLRAGAQRGISQGTAIIVGVIGLAVTLLTGIVIVVNILTGTP
jgi:hypothetical protein